MSLRFRNDGILYNYDSKVKCCVTNNPITLDDLKTPLPPDKMDDRDAIVSRLYIVRGRVFSKAEAEKIVDCPICGRREHPKFMQDIEGFGKVCNNCLEDERIVKCYHCGRYFRRGDGNYWIINVGRERERHFICSECTNHGDFSLHGGGNYLMCAECGDLVLRSNFPNVTSDRQIICERCNHRLNGDIVHPYHYRSDPGYGMAFLGIENRTKHPLLGVELEIEGAGESDEKATEIRTVIGKDKVVACHDGSLRNGFELVSCPANLVHHIQSLNWEGGMKKARELGYVSHDGGRCGLHVHIDRNFFENQDREEIEAKFFISFRNNLEWIKLFSRRFYYEYCVINGYERHDDGSTDTLGHIPYPPDKVWVANKKQTGGRHMALNFEPSNTIEIRIFRGTLNYKTFVATLQLVNMWAKFVKETHYEQIVKLRLQNFVTAAEREGFREFLDYLKSRGIIEGGRTGY